jgi:hypothetical protein
VAHFNSSVLGIFFGIFLFLQLTACSPTSRLIAAEERQLELTGLPVIRILAGNRLVLANKTVVLGDKKLVASLGSDRLQQVITLDRFPPIYVVTFSDGDTRRYRSKRLDETF